MADRYLLESGSPDGYLLEDGSGVLLIEPPVALTLTANPGTLTLTGQSVNLKVASTLTATAGALSLSPESPDLHFDTFPVFHAATLVYSSSSGVFTPGSMPSHQADDILILMVETANEAVTVSGWTEAGDSPAINAGTNPTRLTVFWKRATSGSTPAPSTNSLTGHADGAVLCVRGCNTSGDPFDATASDPGGVGTSVTVPSATTTSDYCLVLIGAVATSSATFSNPTNNLVRPFHQRVSAGDANGELYVTQGFKPSAGAYGTTALTLSSSIEYATWTGALKPANAFTATANEGALTLTGETVNLTLSVSSLTATDAPLTLTPQAATLRYGRKITVNPGTITLTPQRLNDLFWNFSESFSCGFIVNLLPASDAFTGVEYDARLTVDGRVLKIKEFEYEEQDSAVTGTLKVTLANIADRQYVLSDSSLTFEIGIDGTYYTIIDTGSVGATDYTISRQGFLPNDQFTITTKPPELVKLQRSFANGGVIYDPRKVEIDQTAWPFIYSTDGSKLYPEFDPIYGLTLYDALNAAFVVIAEFPGYRTNIPNFFITLAEFHPGDPVVNTIGALIGSFEPDYSVDPVDGYLVIRDGTSGLPSGIPDPRQVTVSHATQIGVNLDQSVNIDGVLLTYQYDTREFDSSSTRVETSTSASGDGENYTETIVTNTFVDYFRNSSDAPIRTLQTSVQTDVYHTVKERVEIGGAMVTGLSLELSESSLETFSYNDKGLMFDRLKTASKLLPMTESDAIPTRDAPSPAKTTDIVSPAVFVDALYEHETVNYAVHPFRPLHLYISDREIHTEGILYADTTNEQLDQPYAEEAGKVYQAGNVTTDHIPFWGAISSYVETGTPLRGGQVRYHILEIDQAAGVVTQNRDEWRDGELGSQGMIHETRELLVGTHTSGVLKPLHAGEAPLSIALPLAQRVLRQANVLTSKVGFNLPFIDLALRKGTAINAIGHDSEDLGNYIVEGRRITGTRTNYQMTLTARQAG